MCKVYALELKLSSEYNFDVKMETLPTDPIVLQQRLATTNSENASLHQKMDDLTQTVTGLSREKLGFQAKLNIWRRAAEGTLDCTGTVKELAEANAVIVTNEFDVQRTQSQMSSLEGIRTSFRQLLITIAHQQNAFIEAMLGRLKAEDHAREMEERAAATEAERDAMRKERDEALRTVENTATLRTLYEQGIEQSREEVARARRSEDEAWAKTNKLGGVHAENEMLREESEELKASEAAARAQNEPLLAELTATQTQLSQTEAELVEVRALLARNNVKTASVIQSLRDDLNAARAENRTIAQQAKELKTERDRFKSRAGNPKKEKGKAHRFNLFFWTR